MLTPFHRLLNRQQKTLLKLLAIFAFSIAAASCGNSGLPELAPDATILAFGDSLTSGKGVSKSKAYPAVLATLTSLKVVNAGISGETTAEGLARLPTVLRRTRPDLMVLLEGGNDILHNQDPAIIKANLSNMINMAEQREIPVVLIGVPTKSLLGKTAGFYTELSKEHDVPLETDVIARLLKYPSMKSDALHFNEAGYSALAQAVADLLKKNGAI